MVDYMGGPPWQLHSLDPLMASWTLILWFGPLLVIVIGVVCHRGGAKPPPCPAPLATA